LIEALSLLPTSLLRMSSGGDAQEASETPTLALSMADEKAAASSLASSCTA
jgi:hypothetical protein